MDGPFSRIASYYDRLVERFGHDVRACDYGRPESQAAKFRVLAEVADLHEKSLLDVGCGFADFAGFLGERWPTCRYAGIDLSPHMIQQASRLRPHLDLRQGNLLDLPPDERFDIITANGIFYLLGPDAWRLTQELIASMFRRATVALAFNSLSSWAPDPEPGEFYADPLAVLTYCRTLTSRVVLRHDYHTRDFTIYLYRETNRP